MQQKLHSSHTDLLYRKSLTHMLNSAVGACHMAVWNISVIARAGNGEMV